MIRKLNVHCPWGGKIAGILLKNNDFKEKTKKIIGIHGWLDNLNSMLPLAEKLIDRNPAYEIYLYDRTGHGFSSHLPKGCDYSIGYNLRDLRCVAQTLGWNNEKFSLIAHSYGAFLAMLYAAVFPSEIFCLVALDALLRGEKLGKDLWQTVGHRVDSNIEFHKKAPKVHREFLTEEKAIELVRSSRIGIDDRSAKLLAERSIRRDQQNRLHFTRDESLRQLQMVPLNQNLAEEAIRNIEASILYIGAVKPQWPISKDSLRLLEEKNRNFEKFYIDGSHHFHMTEVDLVSKRVEEYFQKYFH